MKVIKSDNETEQPSQIRKKTKSKVKPASSQLVHKILERLEGCLQVDAMNMISIRDPSIYKKITFIVEAELYKHKRKLYPKSVNNMGDGYSQFFEDKTRICILKQVKDIIL